MPRTPLIRHLPLSLSRRRFGALAAGTLALGAAGARAQAAAYPAKPVKIVVALAAGGAVDTVGRNVAERLTIQTGQPFVVENKPGANTNIGTEYVARAAPDGYTLLLGSTGIVTNNILYSNLNFNGLRDFAPISRLAYSPLVLVVATTSPYKTVQELVDAGRTKPGGLSYGSAGNGSSGQLAGALFVSSAKVEGLHVPYHGGAPALVDLIADRLSFMLLNPLEVLPHLQSGRLRALAVTSEQRAPLLPKVPTLAEAGLPGVAVTVWWTLLAPTGTPPDIIARLNTETVKALADPGLRERFKGLGAVITPSTPEELGAFLRSESAKWQKVIKDSHITAD
ncbi:MAG: tripartite tricarboxylate transporter substrate binding protein [Pseudomonadota bacterium]